MASSRPISGVRGPQPTESDRRASATDGIRHVRPARPAAARRAGDGRPGFLQPDRGRARRVRPDRRAPLPPPVRASGSAGRRHAGRLCARPGPVDAADPLRPGQRPGHRGGPRQAPRHLLGRARLGRHRGAVRDPAAPSRRPRRPAARKAAAHPERRRDPRPPAPAPLLRRLLGLDPQVRRADRRTDRGPAHRAGGPPRTAPPRPRGRTPAGGAGKGRPRLLPGAAAGDGPLGVGGQAAAGAAAGLRGGLHRHRVPDGDRRLPRGRHPVDHRRPRRPALRRRGPGRARGDGVGLRDEQAVQPARHRAGPQRRRSLRLSERPPRPTSKASSTWRPRRSCAASNN